MNNFINNRSAEIAHHFRHGLSVRISYADFVRFTHAGLLKASESFAFRYIFSRQFGKIVEVWKN